MNLGLLRDWHEHPSLIGWAASPVGRLLVVAAAALLLPAEYRLPVLPLLALAQLYPSRRVDLLALGALWVLFEKVSEAAPGSAVGLRIAAVLPPLVLLSLLFLAARRFRELPAAVRRRPIVATHAALLLGYVLVLFLSGSARTASPAGTVLVALVTIVPFVLWRASYLLLAGKRGTVAASRFRDHLAYLLPAWGGSSTPYGKGHDYLTQRRADGRDAIAAAQLAGLKLLGLVWIWKAVRELIDAGVYGLEPAGWLAFLEGWSLELPRVGSVLRAGGTQAPGILWASLLAGLFSATLRMAITGHAIIGGLRLFGFQVFRNTYKPLLSRSLIEFWGRYYYYYKELLVEFFFYPTFLAHARRAPRTRMVLAVFAAAGLGNLYYHLVQDLEEYVEAGVEDGVARLLSRATYSLLLACGIAVSMIREQERRGKPVPPPGVNRSLRRLRAVLGVWLFFAVLQIWSAAGAVGPGPRVRLCLSLVGLSD